MDIDIVYLWVDGSDKEWQARRNKYIGIPSSSEENCEGRYADNDELRYSLRSLALYAPWVRNIFIVTDQQRPAWLNTAHPQIHIVDHSEIIPKEYLPCFSSRVIEHHICNIPDLAEHFLYANDDMFLNKETTQETFFDNDGYPIVRLLRRRGRRYINMLRPAWTPWHLNNYGQGMHNGAQLVYERYGVYIGDKPHHNIDAYCRSTMLHTRQIFNEEITDTLSHRIRHSRDIQRHIYACAALAQHKGHAEYVTPTTSLKVHIAHNWQRQLAHYNPTFFCLNDSQHATTADRHALTTALATLLPLPSPWEHP